MTKRLEKLRAAFFLVLFIVPTIGFLVAMPPTMPTTASVTLYKVRLAKPAVEVSSSLDSCFTPELLFNW